MVLYTPLSVEDIFPNYDSNYQMVTYKGRSVYARKLEGKWQLVQLMSTNPNDFLQSDFAPGVILPNEIVHDD